MSMEAEILQRNQTRKTLEDIQLKHCLQDACVHGSRDTATKPGQRDIVGYTIKAQPPRCVCIRVCMEAEILQQNQVRQTLEEVQLTHSLRDMCVHGGRDTATKSDQKDIGGYTIEAQPQRCVCVHGGRDTATKSGQKDIRGCTINTLRQKYCNETRPKIN